MSFFTSLNRNYYAMLFCTALLFSSTFIAKVKASGRNAVYAVNGAGNNASASDYSRHTIACATNGTGVVWGIGGDTTNITFGTLPGLASNGNRQDVLLATFIDLPLLSATQSQVNATCNSACNGSGTVVASGGVSPYTYSWSPSGGAAPTASSLCAGNYTCTITDNASNSITKTFTITEPAAIATPTPSSNSPVCTGNTINLSTPAVAGATYSWTGPAAFASALQNPTRSGATVAMAGTYSVTVTVGGCTSAAGTTAVVVNSTPSTPTVSSNSPVCTGNTINLSTPAVAGATYSWTGPSSFASSVQNPTRTNAAVAMAGTYSVTVTTNGCTSAVGTTAVVVNSTPSTPTASSNSPVCTGNTINLSTPAVAGATYSWTGPSSFASSVQNPTRTNAAVAMAGTYSVTVTTNGCTSGVGTTAVVVNSTPSTPTVSSNSPVCTGNTINLSTPAVAGATYSWTGPSSFSSSVQNPSITGATVGMAGTYSVTITTTGCTSAVGTTAVVVNSTPATPTVSSNSPVCTGNTINLSTPAVAGATYSWTGPSSFSSSVQNPSITGATVGMAGTYSVTITTTGCTSAVGTTAVVVNSTPSTPTVSSNSPVCTGNTINLSTPAVAGATYSWTGPSSFASSVQNPSRTNAAVAMAGTYSVTVTTNGCTSAVGTTAVVVNSTPSTPTASSNSPVCTGNTINLSTPAVAGATYSWTGPSSFVSSVQNPTRTNAAVAMAGTYSVTVTTNGCTSAVGTTAVVVNSTPSTPTASSNSPVCTGNTINLSTPAVAGATYSWTGPSSFVSSVQNPTRTNAAVAMAGTYSVTVTTNGCTSAVGTTAVVVNSTPATPTVSSNSPVCTGSTINLSTPAVVGATYSWTGPSSFSSSVQNPSVADATDETAGTYSVTVTVNGCTSPIANSDVIVSSVINTSSGSQTNVSCFGGSNGNATIEPSGGTPGYTYSWAPAGGTAATASGLAAGTYTLTVTDANGCTATRNYTVTEPPVINTSSGSQTNVSCFGGSNGTASVTPSGGTPGYTYSWAPSGGTAATASGLTAGTYTVTVTDANGCTATSSYTITEPPVINTSSGSQTNVSCFGGSNGAASVSPSGGTPGYTYSWAPSGGTAATASGLTAGTYTLTVTDANGCTATRNYTITEPPVINTSSGSQTNVSCFGGSNGAASVTPSGGTPGYTYSWAPSGGTAATASGLTAGTYTLTVTDANGCTATRNYTITEPPVINTSTGSQTNVSCFGGSNGTASVTPSGGTPGYTYSWAPSGGTAATASGLTAGTYTVTVTDANGCTATSSYTITEPPVINTSTGSQTNVSCFGGSNGTASVTPSGGTPGYTYSWAPSGGTAATASGLTAGTYTVTVTDANGCTATSSYTITEPPVINTSSGSQTNVSCFGGSNGAASVTPSGGTPGYTYSWAPSGGTAATASGLTAGTYTVTVTDANGCTATSSYTITEPPVITATTSQTNAGCSGSSTGSASVIASGGTPGYTYLWSPSGGTAATASGLAAGDYTCTITDANGCTITKEFTITGFPAILAITSQTDVTCAGGSTGTATVEASGGTGTITYLWSPSGGTAATAIDLAAGEYTCTITDENLCSITKTFTITEPASIPGSNSYVLPTSNQTVTNGVNNTNFVPGTCELVSTVMASGSSPITGTAASKVWIEGAVPTESGLPFVQRHYEITPDDNAADATGTVTLYFTQAEFDNFNDHPGSSLDLPANPADDAGKANLRIAKYSGVSGDGTGLPSSYTGTKMIIDPDDNDIIWNAVSNSWEVTFDVNGFSGFIVQTSAFILPVNWISFTVKKQGQSVLLNWSTASEHNTRDYTIQHSTDGVHWNTAGIVHAAGNSSSRQNYTYMDNSAVTGYNYYRLMQTDVDGKTNYSEMRVIKLAGDQAPFTVLGNPVGNGILQVQVHQATVFSFYDVTGKLLWLKPFAAGLQSIDVSRYAQGIYLLKTTNGTTQKIFIE